MQLAHAGHAPGRERRLAEHVQERRRIARDHLAGLFQLAAGGTLFEPLDRRIGYPNHSPRASRAAICFEETARRPNNCQGKCLSGLAQFAQAYAQRRILPGAVARFEVCEALDDTNGRIHRNGIVSKAEQAG